MRVSLPSPEERVSKAFILSCSHERSQDLVCGLKHQTCQNMGTLYRMRAALCGLIPYAVMGSRRRMYF